MRGEPGAITAAYGALNAAEKARLSMNAAALVFIDRHLDSVRNRACTVAMMNTRSVGQFDCRRGRRLHSRVFGRAGHRGAAPPGVAPSPRTLAAVRAMTLESRLGFYRLTEDARVQYVDDLPSPIARPLIEILRGEREPCCWIEPSAPQYAHADASDDISLIIDQLSLESRL